MTLDIDTPSLWEVEDADTQVPKVRDMIVAPVGVADVNTFGRRYHYSLSGGSALWRWGLWHDATLYGVVAYNTPTRPVCEAIFGVEHVDKVWHMGRLALPDKAPHNAESRLIGGSLRAIQRDHPNVWAVLTYADTSVGHIGYVYQATNAIYTGTGGRPTFYLDAAGVRHSAHFGGYVTPARASVLGWTLHRSGEKHRYVYILGNKRERRDRLAQLRLPILPYPKDPTLTATRTNRTEHPRITATNFSG